MTRAVETPVETASRLEPRETSMRGLHLLRPFLRASRVLRLLGCTATRFGVSVVVLRSGALGGRARSKCPFHCEIEQSKQEPR